MKYVIIGDVHGRDTWYNIIDKESDADLYIFLGDYVTTHELISSEQQCAICEDILNFKDNNLDKVILLRGNHDCQMLGYKWAQCSGYDPIVAKWMYSIKDRFLSLTQWIYQIPDTNIICSHAGISKDFISNVEKYLIKKDGVQYDGDSIDLEVILENINHIEPCKLFGFTSNRFSDYCGESSTQPCTWIRPTTLAYYMIPDYIQIIGHTPIKHITNLRESNPPFKILNDIWCCDTQLFEYLVINDLEFIIKENDKQLY